MNLLNSATRLPSHHGSVSSRNPFHIPAPFFLRLSRRGRVQEMETATASRCAAPRHSHRGHSMYLSRCPPPFSPHCLSYRCEPSLFLSSFSLSFSLSLLIPRSRRSASLETRTTSEPARVSSFLSWVRPFQSARSRRNGRRRGDRISFVTR